MKTLNRILALLFSLVIFVSSLALAGTLFVRTSLERDHLEELAASLSLKDFIEPGSSEQLNTIVNDLVDSPEFKDLLTTYGYGLLEYMVKGETEVTITKEQELALIEANQDEIVAAIPGANLIPVDRIVDFIAQNIDISGMLPTYQAVLEQIPTEYVTIVRVLNSDHLMIGLVALILASIVALGLVKRSVYRWFRPAGIAFLACGCVLWLFPWLLDLSGVLDAYTLGNIDGTIRLALTSLKDEALCLAAIGIALILVMQVITYQLKKQYR